jgi:GNAT superfamily N-acetyltransferase
MTLRIEKLARHHAIEHFDCGQELLKRFLVSFAWGNQQAHASQTYLGLSYEQVVGFYTLVVGEVDYEEALERLVQGLARHPVPIMLLARLAVDKNWQGKKVGAGLLRDVMLRTLQAADIAGFVLLLSMLKMKLPVRFISILTFYRHQPILCIFFCW